jgi:catechol 2,3-dioxygenase-like lactoylglutathione lyase family enzyme
MRFDHVGVVVEDLESACAFARDVLGLGAPATEVRVDDFGLTAAFFSLGAGRLELVRFDEAGERLPAGQSVRLDHVAVEVDDLDATAARLREQGVRFQEPVRPVEVTEPVVMRGRRHLWTVPETSGGFMLQLTEALAT